MPDRISIIISVIAGVMYGLLLRLLFDSEFTSKYLDNSAGIVMSIAFLFGVPFVIGFLTGYIHKGPRRSVAFYLLSPWISVLLFLALTMLLGYEGFICIMMALPIFLMLGSAGGFAAMGFRKDSPKINLFVLNSFLILPFAIYPVESTIEKERVVFTEHTTIFIKSEPQKVWSNIVKVSPISEEENRSSLFQFMGFPRPIKAELDHEGIGGVRKAIFERGLFFTETVTEWDSLKSFTFTIKADPESIPPTALDEHVTVGGEYFDVLEGKYEIEEKPDGIVLHLTSKFRLSTGFNFYSGFWSKLIMSDIQENILNIIKARCEK